MPGIIFQLFTQVFNEKILISHVIHTLVTQTLHNVEVRMFITFSSMNLGWAVADPLQLEWLKIQINQNLYFE